MIFPKKNDDQEYAHLAHAPIDARRVSKGYDHLEGLKRNYISMPRGPNIAKNKTSTGPLGFYIYECFFQCHVCRDITHPEQVQIGVGRVLELVNPPVPVLK